MASLLVDLSSSVYFVNYKLKQEIIVPALILHEISFSDTGSLLEAGRAASQPHGRTSHIKKKHGRTIKTKPQKTLHGIGQAGSDIGQPPSDESLSEDVRKFSSRYRINKLQSTAYTKRKEEYPVRLGLYNFILFFSTLRIYQGEGVTGACLVF
ncbi:hypothetical protein AVEN_195107-1 [Araneus ventricosus]|uniref:Uncharacterized protein n=1 Tax=Araneus ventricosus TaxID=182803 RepID=A0A4Y2BG20_ARAVE|nr:hypothetical protein AVEN_195107-1 [Araneus ventricosus]